MQRVPNSQDCRHPNIRTPSALNRRGVGAVERWGGKSLIIKRLACPKQDRSEEEVPLIAQTTDYICTYYSI